MPKCVLIPYITFYVIFVCVACVTVFICAVVIWSRTLFVWGCRISFRKDRLLVTDYITQLLKQLKRVNRTYITKEERARGTEDSSGMYGGTVVNRHKNAWLPHNQITVSYCMLPSRSHTFPLTPLWDHSKFDSVYLWNSHFWVLMWGLWYCPQPPLTLEECDCAFWTTKAKASCRYCSVVSVSSSIDFFV